MKDVLIDDNLLEDIRTSINTSKWHDNKVDRIVDFGYTHEYLLSKRNVDDIIKEFYIKSLKEIYSTGEWQELKDLDKQNKSFITNQCSFLIEGALHNRVNLYLKIGSLLELKDEHNLKDEFNYLSDLQPYFKRYAGDFKAGYNQFLNVVVKPYLLFDNSKEEAAHIIFRYITNNESNDPATTLMKEFKINFDGGDNKIDYDMSEGLNEGYIYRAWSIIFSQNELFAPLFKRYLNGDKILDTNKKELNKDEILKMECNLIPSIKLQYVYDFFSILLKPYKNSKPYLSEQKLLTFIESTFVNEVPVPQYFDIPLNKIYIRSVFYKFQINCSDLERNQKKIKKKYYDIMNEGFKGFSDSDRHHWTRTKENKALKGKPKGNYLV